MSNTTDYSAQSAIFTGLGLAVKAKHLKRLAKRRPKAYGQLKVWLKELAVTVGNRTPTNQLFRWNSETKEFLSIFQVDTVVFSATDLNVTEFADGKGLYQMVTEEKVPLRVQPTNADMGPVPRITQLVVLNKEKQTAYYFGKNGHTEKLERALAPFINFSRRARTLTTEKLIKENMIFLAQKRAELAKLLAKKKVKAAMGIYEKKKSVKCPRFPLIVEPVVVAVAAAAAVEPMQVESEPRPSLLVGDHSVLVAAPCESNDGLYPLVTPQPPQPLVIEKKYRDLTDDIDRELSELDTLKYDALIAEDDSSRFGLYDRPLGYHEWTQHILDAV